MHFVCGVSSVHGATAGQIEACARVERRFGADNECRRRRNLLNRAAAAGHQCKVGMEGGD